MENVFFALISSFYRSISLGVSVVSPATFVPCFRTGDGVIDASPFIFVVNFRSPVYRFEKDDTGFRKIGADAVKVCPYLRNLLSSEFAATTDS